MSNMVLKKQTCLYFTCLASLLFCATGAIAQDNDKLHPETLKLEIRDHANREARAEVTSKWIREPEFPRIKLFGAHRGTGTLQRLLTGVAFALPGQPLVSLPEEAYLDLMNANILSDPTILRLKSDYLRFQFSCGDGEKTFYVRFDWDQATGALDRSVQRNGVGVWKAKWKLSNDQWSLVERAEKLE
jgi:hypothetical protein